MGNYPEKALVILDQIASSSRSVLDLALETATYINLLSRKTELGPDRLRRLGSLVNDLKECLETVARAHDFQVFTQVRHTSPRNLCS